MKNVKLPHPSSKKVFLFNLKTNRNSLSDALKQTNDTELSGAQLVSFTSW